ncbi:MAG TPA: hypothetical protein VF607_06355, partial [Verrucomicrobiae bacterium]
MIKHNGVGWLLVLSALVLGLNSARAVTYTLTLYTNGLGTVAQSPTNQTLPNGSTVTLTATPTNGWRFVNWTGTTNSTANPFYVSMTANQVITGNFAVIPNYQLALLTNGQGKIDLSPAGGSYASNSTVTATATPTAGWTFAGWSGAVNTNANPVTLTINANYALMATFVSPPTLDLQPVSQNGSLGGTVTFSAHAVAAVPLVYQWYYSGGPLATVSTNATLTLTNLGWGQAGRYWATVTNTYGYTNTVAVDLLITNNTGATTTVLAANETQLRAALAGGGRVALGFNGPLNLAGPIAITNTVIVDGSKVSAILSGGGTNRIFNIAAGASLTLTNVQLAQGAILSSLGTADGGAIYNSNGVVNLQGCV